MSETALSSSAIRDSYMAELRRRRLYGALALTLFALVMAAGFLTANDRNAGGFLDGLPRLGDYPAQVLSEGWEKRAELPARLWHYLPDLVETLNIAAVSTLVGALAGLGLAFLSIRGLAPWPRLVPLFRRLMDLLRAIPEIVVALVLIFVLGGGPVPAVIAIALHTAGALGKLFSEVAENADLKPVEGLASVGASWGQRMALGVVPQVAPNFLSYALLRFEINVRASAILGFVGAGGIGYQLKNAMAWGPGRFGDAAAIFLLLFGAIVIFDQISGRVRRQLAEGGRA